MMQYLERTVGCNDLPTYFLRRRLPVVNLRSDTWAEAQSQAQVPGQQAPVCLQRLTAQRRLVHLRRNLYLVVDEVREAPIESIASECFSHLDHYVTTDEALAYHRLIDQPIPVITVVTAEARAEGLEVRGRKIQSVYMAARRLQSLVSEHYHTTSDGYPLVVATRALAVADALARPAWMTNFSLLPEVLASFSDRDLATLTHIALGRSHAAAQRLGYFLDQSGIEPPPELATFRPVNAVYLNPRHHHRAQPFSTRWMTRG